MTTAVDRRGFLQGAAALAGAAALPGLPADVVDLPLVPTPPAPFGVTMVEGYYGNVIIETCADVVLPKLAPGQLVRVLNLGKYPITVTRSDGAVHTLKPSVGDDGVKMVAVLGLGKEEAAFS